MESEIPEAEDYSVAARARRILGLMDRLGVKRAALMGNSYGGGIALRMAQDWPDRVERLILINSICYAREIPNYVSLVDWPFADCIADTLPLRTMVGWVLRGSFRTGNSRLTSRSLALPAGDAPCFSSSATSYRETPRNSRLG